MDDRAGGRVTPLRRAAPWLIAGILVAVVGVPATAAAYGVLHVGPSIGYARPLATGGNVTIAMNLTDRPSFSPAFITAKEGTNVTFDLLNNGSYTHTFTLSSVPGTHLTPTTSPAQVSAFFASHPPLANVSLAGGTSGKVTVPLNASTGGLSLEFVSVVPYQLQAGMWGLLNVTGGPGVMVQDNTTDAPSFQPTVLEVNSTHFPISVDVLITNTGNDGHTFTLGPQPNVTISPANFTQYLSMHPPLVNQPIPSGAGSTTWANFTIDSGGVYQYLCEVTGHFLAGMTGFLYVDVAPPAPPVVPSSAVTETWLLGGAGALLVIGVVIAAAASVMGRLPPPKPPQHGHG